MESGYREVEQGTPRKVCSRRCNGLSIKMKDREWEQGQNDHKGGKDFSMVTIPINILDQKESRDTVQLPLGLFPLCV